MFHFLGIDNISNIVISNNTIQIWTLYTLIFCKSSAFAMIALTWKLWCQGWSCCPCRRQMVPWIKYTIQLSLLVRIKHVTQVRTLYRSSISLAEFQYICHIMSHKYCMARSSSCTRTIDSHADAPVHSRIPTDISEISFQTTGMVLTLTLFWPLCVGINMLQSSMSIAIVSCTANRNFFPSSLCHYYPVCLLFFGQSAIQSQKSRRMQRSVFANCCHNLGNKIILRDLYLQFIT